MSSWPNKYIVLWDSNIYEIVKLFAMFILKPAFDEYVKIVCVCLKTKHFTVSWTFLTVLL
jgi:hypothetical protein